MSNAEEDEKKDTSAPSMKTAEEEDVKDTLQLAAKKSAERKLKSMTRAESFETGQRVVLLSQYIGWFGEVIGFDTATKKYTVRLTGPPLNSGKSRKVRKKQKKLMGKYLCCEADGICDAGDNYSTRIKVTNGGARSQPRRNRGKRSRQRDERVKVDMEMYRRGYTPAYLSRFDNPKQNKNLMFYTGQISSEPKGAKIDFIHDRWRDDFRKLEDHHGYIQWLFPIHENSPYNSRAQPLQVHEAKNMRADPKVQVRLIRSYRMMLRFYGLELVDCADIPASGDVRRGKNFADRFANMVAHSHNNLRITRILKCLGELGLEHFKFPLCRLLAV
eukprot:g3045.t1